MIARVFPGNDLNSNGLVGCWKLDSGALDDASGYGYNGSLVAGTITPTNGIIKPRGFQAGAIKLDGSAAYIDCGAAAACNVGAGNPVTVSFWVNMTSVPASALQTFVSFNSTSSVSQNNYFFRYNASAGKFDWGAYNGTYNAITWTASGFVAGQWAHCAGTYDGTTWIIYFNGVNKASTSGATGTQGFAGHLYFGGENNGGSSRGYIQGTMDDVMVYNRALSAAEVFALYSSGWSQHDAEEDWMIAYLPVSLARAYGYVF